MEEPVPSPNTSNALQAYGAGNYMALGLVLQQALIISTLVFLAILALWTQAGPILLLAGMLILRIESPSKCVRSVHGMPCCIPASWISLCEPPAPCHIPSVGLCWHTQDCQLMPNTFKYAVCRPGA